MPIKRLTTQPTEGDLEAEIHHALRAAFPWIPAADLRHQTKFVFTMGRGRIEIDGATVSRAEGRADVIVYAKQKPLAVLELKRGGKPVTPADVEQGLSYARMLHPRPPLVVATNGTDTRIVETHTGEDWTPSEPSAAELAKLIAAAAKVASVDTKEAVGVLLGTESQVWMAAMRAASAAALSDLSGAWDNPLLPFVADFLMPRLATQAALAALQDGHRTVILAGPPLAGKSSVLRELAVQTLHSDDFAVLFIEADGNAGHGVFQKLASLLAATLSWPITSDEARVWLQRLSKSQEGPALVLAIDGVRSDRDDLRRDLEELTSGAYGSGLRVVFTLDDAVVRSFTRTASGRAWSAIGRAAVGVELGPLSDEEFAVARRLLWDQRVGFVHGVEAAAEMRTPWVLRAMVAALMPQPQRYDEKLVAALPPMLGLDLFDHTRARFDDPELRRRFQGLARAALADSMDRTRPIGLVLESVGVFLVRYETLDDELDRADIDALTADGMIRSGVHESGDPVLVVRLPELLASELAGVLSREISVRANTDIEEAASWLVEASQSLPLGDLIAAQAIYDAAKRGGIKLTFITTLLNTPPREERIAPGTRFAMGFPDGGMLDLTLREDGSLAVHAGGEQHIIPPDEDGEPGKFLADLHGWLILSHLVARPFAIQSADGKILGRIDPGLLLELGACPFVLRGPQNDPEKSGVLTHDIAGHGSIVCHRAGIVEPVTMAMYVFLASNGAQASDWLEEAAGRESFPLLARVDISLCQLIDSADKSKAGWAKTMLDDLVTPAFRKFPPLH